MFSNNNNFHQKSKVATTDEPLPTIARSNESKSQELSRHWMEQLQSPPNIITSLRILSTPYLSYLIITQQYEMALYGACIAGASDVIDGYIARRYEMKTVLGSFLDPLADKLLINVMALSLCYADILPVPLIMLWAARDVTLVVGTYIVVSGRTKRGDFVIDPSTTPLQVSATNISKLNTALQFLTLAIGVVQPVYGLDPFLLESCWWVHTYFASVMFLCCYSCRVHCLCTLHLSRFSIHNL